MGVAVSPVPIIAVIRMLFSQRARVNGPVFPLGWCAALVVFSGVAYVLARQGNASTSSTATDTIAWGKIVFGALFVLLVIRTWRKRPSPGTEVEMLALAAGTTVAVLGLPTGQAIGSLLAFVILASLTIGESAKDRLNELKTWLTVHNHAVMPVLFAVLGADHLIAKGLPPLS